MLAYFLFRHIQCRFFLSFAKLSPATTLCRIKAQLCTVSQYFMLVHDPTGGHTPDKLLVDRGFEIGLIDPTLFTKKVGGELFICQLYVDGIIFGSTNNAFNEQFAKLMTDKFEMSIMGELEFFLGFEVK